MAPAQVPQTGLERRKVVIGSWREESRMRRAIVVDSGGHEV
jgi:hypothetical protein